MGVGSTAYNIVKVAHILAAIIGLGAVTLNGLYLSQAAKRSGQGEVAVLEANLAVSTVAEKVIGLMALLGLGLVGMSKHAWKFSQTWVWLAIVLFVVAFSTANFVLKPAHQKLIAALKGEPGGPDAAALRRRLTVGGATLNLVLIAILSLMIFKPGV